MELDDLYRDVSAAILEAERVEEGTPAFIEASGRVSDLEQQIAAAVPASDPEGAIARRGAVRAALAAGERDLAHTLTRAYVDDPEAPVELRQELLELIVARTDVLTFREFVEPFEQLLGETGRICRLQGACPALEYMGNQFMRYLDKLRREHDWLVLTSAPASHTNGRRRIDALDATRLTPRPGGGRVGFVSVDEAEAAFTKILGRSDRKCHYRGDCQALQSTRSRVHEFLDRFQRDHDLLLLKSDGEPWTSEGRLGKLRAVASHVGARKMSRTRLEAPASALVR